MTWYWDTLTGVVDGVNTTFQVSSSAFYAPGSIGVYLNGVLSEDAANPTQKGWVETDPSSGVIDFLQAPLPGDAPFGFYSDTQSPPPTNQDLEGVIQGLLESDALAGSIQPTQELSGTLTASSLSGTLNSSQGLSGSINSDTALQGSIKVC